MTETVKALRRFGLPYLRGLRSSYQMAWDGMFEGYMATTALHALFNVGLLEEMERTTSVDIGAFASERGLDIAVLKPLCEALHSSAIFERRGDTYRLEAAHARMLKTMTGWVELSWGYAEVFNSLEPMLRGEKVYGRDFYRRPGAVAQGSGRVENHLYFPMVSDMIREKGYTRVLDLGCGDGTFLRRLCESNSRAQCVGIDLAEPAIEDGRKKVIAAGLENRIDLRVADISNFAEPSGALKDLQVATIFFVLHELLYFGEEVALKFLHNFRRLFPKVPLIVFEVVRPTSKEMRRHKGMAIYYFLYHDLSQQKPVDRRAWKELFRAAGFDSIHERFLPFVRCSIFTLT
jgi:SAM-dependent methyltransferase